MTNPKQELMPKDRSGADIDDHWATPKYLYDALDAEFKFDFDPCPLHATFDGLNVQWGKSNFVNPPYNRFDKPKFIQKAYEEWKRGNTCVLLIPAATSTKQFHELIYPNAEIRFVKGRIAFEGDKNRKFGHKLSKGKHDSMICIFRGNTRPQQDALPSEVVDEVKQLLLDLKLYIETSKYDHEKGYPTRIDEALNHITSAGGEG